MKNIQRPHQSRPHSAFTLVELSIVLLIMFLVVVVVVGATSMVKAAKMSQARSLTSSSPVMQVEDLVMWLETTSEKSFNVNEVTDGGALTRWYDISPQSHIKNHFTASGANRPTYKKNAVNNLPGVKFDGDNDFMSNSAVGMIGDISTEATWFIVFQSDTSDKAQTFISINGGGNRFYIQLFSDNVFYQGENDDFVGTDATTDFVDKPYIFTVTRKITDNPPISIYLNKELIYNAGNSSIDSSSPYDGAMASYGSNAVIGNYANNNDEAVSGYMLEVIVYSRALTRNERLTIEDYLNRKWGVRLSQS